MMFLLDKRNEPSSHETLVRKLNQSVDDKDLCIFRSIDALKDRLEEFLEEKSILIFRPTNSNELHKMQEIRNLPLDIEMILILPDDDLETLQNAHSLRPRYIAYDNSDYENVVSVARKISRKSS